MAQPGLPALALAWAVLMPALLLAGPPYETDDPEPPDPGQFELFFACYTAAQSGGSAGGAPQFEMNYGAAKDLQLSVSVQGAFDAPRPGAQQYGLGDTLLGAKYRFLQEGGSSPQGALYPQVTLPSGEAQRGLGNGRAELLLPLWFQKSWGPWTSFGGGGYWINPAPMGRNWTFIGAALQRDLNERVSVGAELFFHSADSWSDANGLGSNLACIYTLTSNDQIVASGGRDLGIGEYTFTGYVAYRKLI